MHSLFPVLGESQHQHHPTSNLLGDLVPPADSRAVINFIHLSEV